MPEAVPAVPRPPAACPAKLGRKLWHRRLASCQRPPRASKLLGLCFQSRGMPHCIGNTGADSDFSVQWLRAEVGAECRRFKSARPKTATPDPAVRLVLRRMSLAICGIHAATGRLAVQKTWRGVRPLLSQIIRRHAFLSRRMPPRTELPARLAAAGQKRRHRQATSRQERRFCMPFRQPYQSLPLMPYTQKAHAA